MNSLEIDWSEYFHSIREQCPWSYGYWHKGLIDIVEYRNFEPQPLGAFEARVYITDFGGHQLEQVCDRLDQSQEYEWLWSEPGYGPYATAVPCLIQQWREKLSKIRNSIALDK